MSTANETTYERLSIAGLRAPVDILIDRWGIPHIRAENLADLFFAQGFNAGRDRLWQIDLARKRGLGLLAREFGAGYLAQDRASRLFLYRGNMEMEWAAYGADAKEICTSFAQGINAYIDLTEREPDRLPPEFTSLGTRPAKWQPEDVVRIRTHGWMRNAVSEIVRAHVLAKTDADTDLLRTNLNPLVVPQVPEGIELGAPLGILDVYRLATSAVTFKRERLEATLDDAWAWSKVTPAGDVIFDELFQPHGSNNWTIAGERTRTGRPILANDPHRAHAAPSLRYLVHLTAPGFNAIGTGEAIFPGIVIGHNGDAAFGLTLFFGHDEEDVYVYETQRNDPNRYRYGDGWEEMSLIDESFSVKGERDQKLTLKFTRHGPIVYEDSNNDRAYAIRTVWSEPGTTAYGASLISMRARNFPDFRSAMRKWGVPAVNQVYADRSGTIGWVAAGFAPLRKNWDGLLPVPGDGRFEWNGFIDADQLPWARNPSEGFFATSNEMNVPRDWPRLAKPIGYEWWEGSRAARVHEVLAGQAKHSIEDSVALQTDVFSIPARRLKAILSRLKPVDPGCSRALEMLRAWDCRLTADTGPGCLFELWWSNHLKPALFQVLVPDATIRPLLLPGDVDSILRVIENPPARLGNDPVGARDQLLLSTLAAAFRDAVSRMGADSALWAWGRLHYGYFSHAVTTLLKSSGDSGLDVGPFVKAGGDSTPMMAMYRTDTFRVWFGASARIVIDVGEWDNSVWINAPGQSGDPRSPHYADLAPLWAKGEYVPMLYTSNAVEQVTEKHIRLETA
jgi:penicillin G amidase